MNYKKILKRTVGWLCVSIVVCAASLGVYHLWKADPDTVYGIAATVGSLAVFSGLCWGFSK